MSWQVLNTILGLAATDRAFQEELLKNPLAAIQSQQFQLSQEEEEILNNVVAQDLNELSQILLEKLAPEK